MLTHSSAATHGFTLIEAMITVAVAALLVVLGLPSFFAWIQNQKIRTASEAVLNGLQLARAEAISRNVSTGVRLIFAPASGDWTVNTVPAAAAPLHSRAGQEGTSNATYAVTPSGATMVTFGPLGSVIPNSDASPSILSIDVANPKVSASDGARPLRITVKPSGNMLMCDPLLSGKTPPDPRGC